MQFTSLTADGALEMYCPAAHAVAYAWHQLAAVALGSALNVPGGQGVGAPPVTQ